MAKKAVAKVTGGAERIPATIMNGISQAIMGFEPGGIGTQLSQVDTLFKNNRWYLVSNMRQLTSQVYVEHGIIQTVIDVPVEDAFRGGVSFKSKQLDEDQLLDLKKAMKEQGDIEKLKSAQKWNRLFGGAGVIIMSGQDPATPLNMDALANGPLEFRDCDMWELFWSKQNTSDYSAAIDNSEFNNVEFYDYYGIKVHHSRVIKLEGIRAPSFIRPRLRGWGFSVLEALVRSINQYLKANDLTFEVLDEFKVDVYKIKGYVDSLLRKGGAEQVNKRIQHANQTKNYQRAIVMDKEDDYVARELSFAGISETMIGIRMQIASDLRMPLTKVFGISAAGFSSGEDDIENYNAMVESSVREKSRTALLMMAKIRCIQLFGFIPDDLEEEFQPLRMLSAEQEENVKTSKFNRIQAARTAGEISSKEYREAINKDNLLPIKLDTELADTTLGKPVSPEDQNKEAPNEERGAKSLAAPPEAKEAKV